MDRIATLKSFVTRSPQDPFPRYGLAMEYKNRGELATANMELVAIGFLVSFVVALAVIRAMLAIITKRGLAPFGWFRILVGGVGLALLTFAH